jgi:DNA-nicking Smr family endonuclease
MKTYHLSKKEFIKRQQLDFPSQATLDYHNRGILDAFDVEKIFDDFAYDCVSKNYLYLIVICGKGKLVRPTIQKVLKTHTLVEYFKDGGYYTGGKGAFLVKLK